MTEGEKLIWAAAFAQTRLTSSADHIVEVYRRYLELARHPQPEAELQHTLILEFADSDDDKALS